MNLDAYFQFLSCWAVEVGGQMDLPVLVVALLRGGGAVLRPTHYCRPWLYLRMYLQSDDRRALEG